MNQPPKYSDYKSAGVPWFGEIPTHWKMASLKYLVSTPITDGPHETPSFHDEGVPFVSAEAVGEGCINFLKIRGYISRKDHERYSKKYKPLKSDIYMVKSGATTGVTAIVDTDREFNIWSPLAAIRPSDSIIPTYLLSALRSVSFQDGIALNWSYGTQQNIGMGVLGALPVPVPPYDEQRRLAAFLDRETARIDALIEKKTRFIDLLKEKRQALITQAVTKGLDPTVPMKDSGVELIGEVPAHWRVCRLKHLNAGALKYGANESGDADILEGPRYIRITDLSEDGSLKPDGVKRLPEKIAGPYMLEDGDILLARSGATVGKSFIYKSEFGPSCFAGYLIRVRLDDVQGNPDFISLVMQSKCFWDYIRSTTIQATIENVSAERYGDFALTVPPLDEQLQIVEWLSTMLRATDAITTKTRRSIELLTERRSALITAAVTGQIDLREDAA